MPDSRPIDYRPVELEEDRIISVPVLIASLVLFGILTASMLVVLRFETIFKDFKIELPGITMIALVFARFYLNDFGWIAALAVAVGVPFVVPRIVDQARDSKTRSRRRRWVVRITTLLAVCFVIVLALALFSPMVALTNTVSTPANK